MLPNLLVYSVRARTLPVGQGVANDETMRLHLRPKRRALLLNAYKGRLRSRKLLVSVD